MEAGEEFHDRRLYPRLGAQVPVVLVHETCGALSLITRDFSESGVFLLVPNGITMPEIGTTVTLYVGGADGAALPQKSVIVRREKKGIGLAFC